MSIRKRHSESWLTVLRKAFLLREVGTRNNAHGSRNTRLAGGCTSCDFHPHHALSCGHPETCTGNNYLPRWDHMQKLHKDVDRVGKALLAKFKGVELLSGRQRQCIQVATEYRAVLVSLVTRLISSLTRCRTYCCVHHSGEILATNRSRVPFSRAIDDNAFNKGETDID
jgi:hypothetical protein